VHAGSQRQEYATGYDECERTYLNLQTQRETSLRQLYPRISDFPAGCAQNTLASEK